MLKLAARGYLARKFNTTQRKINKNKPNPCRFDIGSNYASTAYPEEGKVTNSIRH